MALGCTSQPLRCGSLPKWAEALRDIASCHVVKRSSLRLTPRYRHHQSLNFTLELAKTDPGKLYSPNIKMFEEEASEAGARISVLLCLIHIYIHTYIHTRHTRHRLYIYIYATPPPPCAHASAWFPDKNTTFHHPRWVLKGGGTPIKLQQK